MHPLHEEPDSSWLDHLSRIGAFSLSTCWRCPDGDEVLPAHSEVIRPLLRTATVAYVWAPSKEASPLPYPAEILHRERGRYRFDLSRDVLTGYEGFWNASCHRRGSIVLRLPFGATPDLAEVFRHCSGPSVYSSRYQLAKGESRAAIRYCDDCASHGDLAFCFSASNGIEHLSVFAPPPALQDLYRQALDSCRPFKRWFECSPGEDVNLIPSGAKAS